MLTEDFRKTLENRLLEVSSKHYSNVVSEAVKVHTSIHEIWSFLPHTSHRRYKCIVVAIDGNNQKRQAIFFGKRAPEIEYDNMNLIRSYLNGITIPRPLEYIEKYNILLMENITGTSLWTLVVSYCLPIVRHFTKSRVRWAITKVALELARLHNSTIGEIRPYYDRSRLRAVKEELREVGCFEERDYERILVAIEKLSGYLDRVPTVLAHCEFGPRNVMVSKKGITIIDCPHLREHNVFYDSSLFIYSLKRIGCTIPWAKSYGDDLLQLFTSKYLQFLAIPCAHELFEKSRVINLAEIVINFSTRLSKIRSKRTLVRARKFVEEIKLELLKEAD